MNFKRISSRSDLVEERKLVFNLFWALKLLSHSTLVTCRHSAILANSAKLGNISLCLIIIRLHKSSVLSLEYPPLIMPLRMGHSF